MVEWSRCVAQSCGAVEEFVEDTGNGTARLFQHMELSKAMLSLQIRLALSAKYIHEIRVQCNSVSLLVY